MSSPLRTIIVDADPESRATLRGILAGNRAAMFVAEFSDIAEALIEGPARRPDLLIVQLPQHGDVVDPDKAEKAVEELSKAMPDVALFATAPPVSGDFVIRVIRAGAVEFLTRPVERAHVLAALDKIARRRGSASRGRSGRITSVFAAKGGLGVTTMATNLAVCLATANKAGNVLLIDLDSRQSDVSTFLNLRPTYSVLDAFENIGRMDESFLRGLLSKHPSGVWVLPGPSRMERIQLGAEPVRIGLDIMRSYFDHLVLDLRHDLDPGSVTALEVSDTILFLTGLDVAAVRAGRAALAAFRSLGINMQKVKVVVMREDTGEEVKAKHVKEALDAPVFWKIPNDYVSVVAAINTGDPVVMAAPRSKVARSVRALGDWLGQASAEGKSQQQKSFSLKRLMWNPKGSR
jgi:pilus assembly protein CpaE